LFAGLQPHLSGRRAASVGALLGALTVLRRAEVGAGWIDHRRDLAELRAAIAQVEPGARVLAASGALTQIDDGDRRERVLPGVHRVDTHLAALLVIERRAFWPQMFAHPGMQPLVVRAPFDRIAEPLGEPVEWHRLEADQLVLEQSPVPRLSNWRSDFDQVLLIGPPRPKQPVAGLAPLYLGSYVQLYRIEPAAGDNVPAAGNRAHPERPRSASNS
jgi:hypothetical protein